MNRQFFYKYASPMISLNISYTFFCFYKSFKVSSIYNLEFENFW